VNTGSPAELFAFFINRCRTNLHVVLCLSPIGDAFRTVSRTRTLFQRQERYRMLEHVDSRTTCLLLTHLFPSRFSLQRLRMFPSLVNCCTIDWFTEWPEQALRSVAVHFLDPVEMDPKVNDLPRFSYLKP
jgi:dynein heavy chain